MLDEEGFDGGDDEDSEEIEFKYEKTPLELEHLMDLIPVKSEELAIKYIDVFFCDEDWHCGGKIPKSMLHSPFHVKMVLELDVCAGVDKAHELLEKCEGQELESPIDGSTTSSIFMLNEAMSKCRAKKIPKVFQSGITIMYLELCKGIEMPKNVARRGFSKD